MSKEEIKKEFKEALEAKLNTPKIIVDLYCFVIEQEGYNKEDKIEILEDVLRSFDVFSFTLAITDVLFDLKESKGKVKCTCPCHSGTSIMHFMASCNNGYIDDLV